MERSPFGTLGRRGTEIGPVEWFSVLLVYPQCLHFMHELVTIELVASKRLKMLNLKSDIALGNSYFKRTFLEAFHSLSY